MSVKPTAKPKEIIEEINKLRSNPPLYANKVEEYSKYFTDNIIKLPNLNIKIQTQEGPAPYLETVEYLKGLEKVNELIPSKALCEIAQEFADNVKDSETGEIDEEIHEQIIDKHGSFTGRFTRAMDFGGFTSEQVVINFLVCDGDTERSQREPVLGTGLNKIGIAFGKHNVYSTVCVLVTCTEFQNTKDPDDTMIFIDPEEEEKKEKERLEKEKLEKERLEKEKLENERLEKEKLEKESLEKERLEKERLEKERLEKERLEKERLEREKAEREKKEQTLADEKEKERLEKERLEKERLEKERLEKERLEREKAEREKAEREKAEREKAEKEKAEKERIAREKKEKEEKKKEEEKKTKEVTKKKYGVVNTSKGETTNIFKLKKKIYSYEAVPKDQLPEGVASMTKSDTIVIEGGKRYKKIIYNKVMLDGSKKTEEVKQCLD